MVSHLRKATRIARNVKSGRERIAPFPPARLDRVVGLPVLGYGPKNVKTRLIRSAFCVAVPNSSNGNDRKTTL